VPGDPKRVPASDARCASPARPHALHAPDTQRAAAALAEELKCPLSSTERGTRVELNEDTCTLCTLHTQATGFAPKEMHCRSFNALKRNGIVDFYAVLCIITRGLLKTEQTHKTKCHGNRVIFDSCFSMLQPKKTWSFNLWASLIPSPPLNDVPLVKLLPS